MGVWDLVMNQFGRIDYGQLDFDLMKDTSERVHMRRIASETVLGFMTRAAMQTEYRILDPDGKVVKDEAWYRLNVQPNMNQSAAEFWGLAYRKILEDGELLIIQSDDGGLLIADDFGHNSYAVKPDTFYDVTTRDYTYGRTFDRTDVVHMQYRNEKLDREFEELYKDYGSLFGQLMEFQRVKNQLRATVDIDALTAKTKDGQVSLQKFIDSLYSTFKDKTVAIIPQQKGLAYNEHSRSGGAGETVDELEKIRAGYIDAYAEALGVPSTLLHASNTDNSGQVKFFIAFTLKPLVKVVTDDLKTSILTKQQLIDGYTIEAKMISYKDLTELAEGVNKLISSGAFTPNDVLREIGRDPVDNPDMDKHYITKNFVDIADLDAQTEPGAASTKGGET